MLASHARWYTFLPPQWSTIPPPLTFTNRIPIDLLFSRVLVYAGVVYR